MSNNSTEANYTQSFVNKNTFSVIPSEDLIWTITQKPCVIVLFNYCWGVDPFGDRWVEIKATFPESTFRKARKVLKDTGLFDFRTDTDPADNRRTSRWLTRNLKGSKSHLFKSELTTAKGNKKSEKIDAHYRADNPSTQKIDAHNLALSAHLIAADAHYRADNLPETHTQQASCNPSLLDQQLSITKENKDLENKPIDPKENKDQGVYTPSARVSACAREENHESVGVDASLKATHPKDQGEEWKEFDLPVADKIYKIKCLISEYREIETFRGYLAGIEDISAKTKKESSFNKTFLMAYRHRVLGELTRLQA